MAETEREQLDYLCVRLLDTMAETEREQLDCLCETARPKAATITGSRGEDSEMCRPGSLSSKNVTCEIIPAPP